jgi:hypothetical protein
MRQLEQDGHEILFDWTKIQPSNGDHNIECAVACAAIDAIKKADLLVGYMMKDLPYKGSYGELSIGVALNKPVLIVGTEGAGCCFTHHPNVKRFEKMSELRQLIQEFDMRLSCDGCSHCYASCLIPERKF